VRHDHGVTVRGPSAQQYDVRPGESLVFGSCGCAECQVQVRVAPGPGEWLRGVLHVYRDHWRLDNLSPDVDFVSLDLEDLRQRVRVPARRIDVVVPFELARLSLGEAEQELVVFGHEPRLARVELCAQEVHELAQVRLNPSTAYMAVLEELCRSGSEGTVPTSVDIASALRRRGMVATPRAVDRHIDYLYRRFYPDGGAAPRPVRPGWKRRAVANAGSRALRCCAPPRGSATGTTSLPGC